MLTLYKSLVRSHWEYCCPLWNNSKVLDIQLIEGLQRNFTSRISGVQHQGYWQRLKALNLMSMQRRRERYVIIHMWKILQQRCPNDLGVQFSAPSRHGIKARIPGLSKKSSQHHLSLYDGSFAVMGPHLWNIIPSSLHSIEDQLQFKIKLTGFLKSFPDNPPVSSYSCPNGNSILDWNMNKAAAMLQGRSNSTGIYKSLLSILSKILSKELVL